MNSVRRTLERLVAGTAEYFVPPTVRGSAARQRPSFPQIAKYRKRAAGPAGRCNVMQRYATLRSCFLGPSILRRTFQVPLYFRREAVEICFRFLWPACSSFPSRMSLRRCCTPHSRYRAAVGKAFDCILARNQALRICRSNVRQPVPAPHALRRPNPGGGSCVDCPRLLLPALAPWRFQGGRRLYPPRHGIRPRKYDHPFVLKQLEIKITIRNCNLRVSTAEC